MREGAVMAYVPAKLGQRDKHLTRIRNRIAVRHVPAPGGCLEKTPEIAQFGERKSVVSRERGFIGKSAQELFGFNNHEGNSGEVRPDVPRADATVSDGR